MFKKKKHKFFYISMRGRAAYLILCLEEALKYYDNNNLKRWKWLLNELWKITSTWDIDGWIGRVTEATYDSIMEFNTYQERIEHDKSITFTCCSCDLSEEEFVYLHELYSENQPFFPVIFALCDKIIDVIALNAGDPATGCCTPYSPFCLPLIDEAEGILVEHGIPFPQNIDAISYIMKHKDRYYGPTFDGHKFSILSDGF